MTLISRHASVSQTIAQIRQHYQARRAQGNAGPYSPYSPYLPYLPYTPYPGKPPITPPGETPVTPTTVGMMSITNTDLCGLQGAFQTIYTGDPAISHRACNHVHAFGHNFDDQNVWGLTDNDRTSDKEKDKLVRNAKAWGNFVRTVARANIELGGDVLKCIISRPLVGLRKHPDRDDYEWKPEELKRYVQLTINEIDAIDTAGIHPNPRSLVAGWKWNDDGVGHEKHKNDPDLWLSVLETVHNAQKESGVNWPFYWADPLDFEDPACPAFTKRDCKKEYDESTGCEVGSPLQFWRSTKPGDADYPDWVFHVPDLVTKLIEGFPSDATPVFMLQHYSWTAQKGWDYTRQPPWRILAKILEALDAKFSRTKYPRLRIEPILHAAEKIDSSGLVGPGHADIHKQIRVATEIANELDRGSQVKRFTGFWFMGWNGAFLTKAMTRNLAESNWLTGRRYAEAIQNEPHGTEGIQEAIPSATNILQNFPDPFYVDPEPETPMVTRIPYHLAERKPFRIEIREPSNSVTKEKGKLRRTLTEGYTDVSPQGKFSNTNRTGPGIPAPKDLNGTSAHWDGKDDDNLVVDNGTYEAWLVVGEKPNETYVNSITLTKDPPPTPEEDNSPVKLTLTGPDTVRRVITAAYTARIVTEDSLAPLTYKWTYTPTFAVGDGDDVMIDPITKFITATSTNPKTTTWTGRMVKSGTLNVEVTVKGTKYTKSMNVTVNDRTWWHTEVPFCTDSTGWGIGAPRAHSDLGRVEYSMPIPSDEDLEIEKVVGGPNDGIWYIKSLNLVAPFRIKINRHFRTANADLPLPWRAFKNVNARYGEIEDKVKTRLGFDQTTSGTLYGDWRDLNDPEKNRDLAKLLEKCLGTDGTKYEKDIKEYLLPRIANRIAEMKKRESGWSPAGITINYGYGRGDV